MTCFFSFHHSAASIETPLGFLLWKGKEESCQFSSVSLVWCFLGGGNLLNLDLCLRSAYWVSECCIHPDGGSPLGIEICVLPSSRRSRGNSPVCTHTRVFVSLLCHLHLLLVPVLPAFDLWDFFGGINKHKEFFFFLSVPFVIRFWSISNLLPRLLV